MPDRLRILVVTTALVPDQLETWRCAADDPDIDLHIAGSLRHDPSESYLAPLGVPSWGTVHVLEARGVVRRGRLWWNLKGLESLIETIEPAVVHVHSEVWGRLVSQSLRTGAPIVAHGAENVSLEHGGRLEAFLRRAVARRNARRLAGYASWNEAGIEILRANGLAPGAPTAVAPAIVPSPGPFSGISSIQETSDRVVVGYLGRLVPEKGVQWLLCALDGVPGMELLVVGGGPYENQLRSQARRRGIRVVFKGSVRPTDIPELLGRMNIVVVPSISRPGWAEQFGRVVCEAMFAGLPVISSDSGSLSEVVGDAGVVVGALNHQDLHEALVDLVQDAEARAVVGKRGREWALANLAPEAAARRLVQLWRAVDAA